MDLGQQVVATDPIHIVEDVTVPRRDSSITAWVNVIYGCNERCTYCVVPNTRGQEQSREPDAIMVRPQVVARARAPFSYRCRCCCAVALYSGGVDRNVAEICSAQPFCNLHWPDSLVRL